MGRKSRRKRETVAPPVITEPNAATGDARSYIVPSICAALVMLVAIVFAQLRDHQFLNYDDDIYVTANDHVKAGLTASGVRWAFTSMDFNWHPVTWLSHMTDVQLFGVNPGAHLLINAVFHAANAILLFLLLMRATRRTWPSAIVAALFAVHPLHVESVAWLAERKDVLSTFFFLVTLLLYVMWTERRSAALYVALVITFALGLMSKGMLVTLPFILLLIDFWPLQRVWNARLIVEKLPLFALIIPSAYMTYRAQHAVHAVASSFNVPLSIRLANAAISYVSYLAKTAWPWPLAIPYPYATRISPTLSILAAVLIAGICAVVIVIAKRRRYLFTGWFWFLGSLVPVIGLVQIGVQSMADRYTYIPLIGLFIAVVWLVDSFLDVQTAGIAAGVAIAALTIVAHIQASYWRDSETLFTHAVAVTRGNYTAHLALGAALIDKKDFERAIGELQTAVDLTPRSAVAHRDLGSAYAGAGKVAEAAAEFQKAIAIDPADQRAQTELAALSLQTGDVAGALERFVAVAQANPQSAAAHNDVAAALARAGRDDDAMREYADALRLDPQLYSAHMNIAALLSRHNRQAEAIAHLETAKKIQPDSTEPHIYLALVLAQTGRTDDAVREAEAALAIDEATANTELTAAVHAPAAPDNLRQFINSLRSRGPR